MITATPYQTRTSVPPVWSVADRLRKARESAGLDQRELAERAGISRQTVSNAERGAGHPQRATLRVWAMATGVPLEWLLEGDKPATERPRRRVVLRRHMPASVAGEPGR